MRSGRYRHLYSGLYIYRIHNHLAMALGVAVSFTSLEVEIEFLVWGINVSVGWVRV